ncbi:uncharacterized protein LOC128242695 [Mya arenaria]|uniref:uncharacterized protein LOC128242695 n=1 Tax=Mya arenaria TaxID=6604 RepID=UPI0022E32E73|nr:uncharacterized protein LOC128242695 [Mya arenaria]
MGKEADIEVKISQDWSTCWITSCAEISPGLFLMADRANSSVKLVDLTIRIVTSSLQLQGWPWDLCVLPDDQAAVTLPDKSIVQLLSTKGGQLSLVKELKVSDSCHVIAFYNNQLYLSYCTNEPRIEVMTMDGVSEKEFQNDRGNQLFQSPYHLTMSALSPPNLYVPDYITDTVFELSLDGKVVREYQDKHLVKPLSVVAVSPDLLLVCGRNSHNVMKLSETDGSIQELLGEKDGLSQPYSVAFCPHKRTVIVGMYPNNIFHQTLKEV